MLVVISLAAPAASAFTDNAFTDVMTFYQVRVEVDALPLVVAHRPLRDTLASLAGHSAYLLSARGEQSRSAKRLVSERSKCGREGGPFLTISENHKQQRDTTRLLSKQYSLAAPQTIKKTAAGTQQARYNTQLSLSLYRVAESTHSESTLQSIAGRRARA